MTKKQIKDNLDLIENDAELKEDIIRYIAFSVVNKYTIDEIVNELKNIFDYTFEGEIDKEFVVAIRRKYIDIAKKIIKYNNRPANISRAIEHVENVLCNTNDGNDLKYLQETYESLVRLNREVSGESTERDQMKDGALELLANIRANFESRNE